MAKFELNIYGENDEILKTYKTDRISWGLLGTALKLQDELNGAEPSEQLEAVGALVKDLFVGLTDEELERADVNDVLALVAQIGRTATKLKTSKNV